MFEARTFIITAALLAAWGLLSLPAWLGPESLAVFSGAIYMVPVLSIYFFHWLGVPGVLQHDGACGWGMCAPTMFGVAFTALFWIGVVWLFGWGLSRLGAKLNRIIQRRTR